MSKERIDELEKRYKVNPFIAIVDFKECVAETKTLREERDKWMKLAQAHHIDDINKYKEELQKADEKIERVERQRDDKGGEAKKFRDLAKQYDKLLNKAWRKLQMHVPCDASLDINELGCESGNFCEHCKFMRDLHCEIEKVRSKLGEING